MALDQYRVFGDPIEHSKSPTIHALFAEQCGEALEYSKQRVAPENFTETCDDFFQCGGRGLNITLPLKELAFHYAHKTTVRAELAGAVNTLAEKDGTLWGDNTDGVGLATDLFHNLGWEIEQKRVLILGAGGAVRGVLAPLLERGPKTLVIANRTAAKAESLAQNFIRLGPVSAGGYEDIPAEPFDLIINGTSMSLSGAAPPIPGACLGSDSACYDLAYAKEPTAFLRWAERQGCQHRADGLGMLVEQAAEAFQLWRGVRPKTAPVIASLR